MLKTDNKFKFTIEYQWDLLRFTLQDKKGDKAIKKYEDDYFTLIEHQVLAFALKTFYKKEKRLPGETLLREKIVQLLNSKQYINLVTKEQQKNIIDLVKPLYTLPVKDGDSIYSMLKEFRSYVQVKSLLENVDINDYSKYSSFAKQIQLAITDEDEQEVYRSSFLFENVKERQFNRQAIKTIYPTPYRQINQLTNAGGYEGGSILVILDKQKKGKTKELVNLARGYLRMKKKVLYIDLENGKDNIMTRLDQSIMGLTKQEVLSGEHDVSIQRRYRKYKRLGGELVVLRLPALVTSCNDIQKHIDILYREHGFRPEELIIDYGAKLASNSRREDDHKRISDVYLELNNLAIYNDIEHVWTANHVTREGAKSRMATRYVGEDIALCIDIVRHAQAVFGLNRSKQEEEAGIIRLEIVEQRDGQPEGRAVMRSFMATQRSEELSIAERKEYDEDFYPMLIENETKIVSKKDRKNDFQD